jgi:hypothetical protein
VVAEAAPDGAEAEAGTPDTADEEKTGEVEE